MGRRKLTPEELAARGEKRVLYYREYEAKNREKRKAQKAAWAAANKEKLDAARAKRIAADPEGHRQRLKASNGRRDPAKSVQRQKAYAKRHPEVRKETARAYQAAKRRATPSWLTDHDKAMIAGLHATAMMLSASSGIRHTLDHVVPLQNASVCGLNVPSNLQILSLSQNCSKGNRVWPDMW